MTLKRSSEVESPLQFSVVKVFWSAPGVLKKGGTAHGAEMIAEITSVTQTSDATPGECMFSVDDPETATVPLGTGAKSLIVPAIGDGIVVTASTVTSAAEAGSESEDILFKGFVIDVAHNKGDNGSIYSVRCTDMKARMADVVLTKSYNEIYQIASRPNFSEHDREETPFEAREWTVGQIIKDLLATANKHAVDIASEFLPLSYFEYGDFIFSEVKDLEDFVPGVLHFENISLLEAIFRTISESGTYRMAYNQRADKIIFTRLSTKAKEAGRKRDINFATADKHMPNADYVGDNGINIIADNTSRRTSDLATIFRYFSAHIEWYSGHYYIDGDHEHYRLSSPNHDSIYFLSNRNWDGYKYHAPMYTLGDFIDGSSGDVALNAYCIVGCPLYPQWNVLAGYEPHQTIMKHTRALEDGEKLSQDGDGNYIDITDESYSTSHDGEVANEGYTALDIAFPRGKAFTDFAGGDNYSVALGYTYEAWYPWPGVCAYCNGTGTVSNVSTSWREHYEDWFGNSRNANGSPNKPGMSPFSYSYDSNGNPTKHPVPWNNTCPACRGNGREPRFKITNILNSFMDVTPDKKKIGDSAAEEFTQMTWDQMVQDLDNTFGPKIQMEKTTEIIACSTKNEGETMPQHSLWAATSQESSEEKIFPIDKRHPYNDRVSELYKTQIEINAQANIDHKRGNVVFTSRVGIPCKKPTRSIKTEIGKKTVQRGDKDVIESTVYHIFDKKDNVVYSDQMIDPRQTTFWRPARAWISCFFKREKLFDDCSEHRNPSNLSMPNPDEGQDSTYRVGVQVWDGRAVYEVKDKHPDDDTEFDVRPVIKGKTGEEFRWQISPDDLYKYLMPTTEKMDWTSGSDNTRTKMQASGYYFSEASAHITEPLREYEAKLLSGTVKKDGIMRNNIFGKPVRWLMRDDRFKLIKRAVMELERRNNIQITGSLEIRGTNFDIDNGLGYVEFEDGLKACIVKIEHNFGGGMYTTSLELTTEEFRLGEEREKDLDYKRQMDNKISNLYMNPEFDAANALGNSRTSGRNYNYDPSHMEGGVL